MTITTQILTYKCRLQPTRQQRRALEAVTEQQRQLYNAALQERIEAFSRKVPLTGKGISVSVFDQGRSLTQIRADDPAFRGVQRRIQAGTLDNLDRAYKAFFKRAKAGAGASAGFPRFKGRDFFRGFRFNAPLQIKWDGKRLRFAGVPGGLRVSARDRARLPTLIADPKGGGTWKGVSFSRDGNRWSVCFQAEVPIRPRAGDAGSASVGVDWGTSVLAMLSTGEELRNDRPGMKLAAEQASAQRSLARKKKGSKRRMKARRRTQAVARRIANKRSNNLNKVSARLVRHYGTVVIEDIAVKKMTRSVPKEDIPPVVTRGRNRAALDAAPYKLRQMLTYKAVREGCELIVVPAEHTTQDCSHCGTRGDVALVDREFHCENCGSTLPRKLNAAINILNRAGRGSAGGEQSPKPDDSPVRPRNTSGRRKPIADGARGSDAALSTTAQMIHTDGGSRRRGKSKARTISYA